MTIRSESDLTDVSEPAWPDLQDAIASAVVAVEVLDVAQRRAAQSLLALQVSTASTLGALAYHCGGLLIDHGWVRVLGGGTDRLASLASANGLTDDEPPAASPPFLIIAFDVLGGRFAIDGGGLGFSPGEICYWGPDTLAWSSLGVGHSAFVRAFLGGASEDFYAPLRWPGWESEVANIPIDQGLSLLPPPFAEEGRDLAGASRRPVPFHELLSFYDEVAEQLSAVPAGQSFRLEATD